VTAMATAAEVTMVTTVSSAARSVRARTARRVLETVMARLVRERLASPPVRPSLVAGDKHLVSSSVGILLG
jgi:hypothetical protein